jgi:DNA gyrase/topoisomerase IV subunit B
VVSGELLRPLKDVRRAVYFALSDKVKRQSRNQRTYYSKYHRPGKDIRLSAYKQKERGQVAITILGDRRPYTVSVVYKIEALKGRKYELARYDKELAELYLSKVEEYLAGRPEERDVIDDFRPY